MIIKADDTFTRNQVRAKLNEAAKAQEIVAIGQVVAGSVSSVSSLKQSLDTNLEDSQKKMHEFASQKVVSNFQKGLTGEAADSATEQLKSETFNPTFSNPIKG